MLLTVNDLALAVSNDADDLPLMIGESGTGREKLLPFSGSQNPGTGRKREYPARAVQVAKILNTLAEFGIGIGKTKQFYFEGRDMISFSSIGMFAEYAVENIAKKILRDLCFFNNMRRKETREKFTCFCFGR